MADNEHPHLRFEREATERLKQEDEARRAEIFSRTSVGGKSSLAALLMCVGLFIGIFAGADQGGMVPLIGGVVGGAIGFFIGKVLSTIFRLLFRRD